MLFSRKFAIVVINFLFVCLFCVNWIGRPQNVGRIKVLTNIMSVLSAILDHFESYLTHLKWIVQAFSGHHWKGADHKERWWGLSFKGWSMTFNFSFRYGNNYVSNWSKWGGWRGFGMVTLCWNFSIYMLEIQHMYAAFPAYQCWYFSIVKMQYHKLKNCR